MYMYVLVVMAAAMASPAEARGIGDGAVGRASAPGPRHPQTAAFTPFFCGGVNGNADDDRGDPDHQSLFVDLTGPECTSTNLPLLASALGFTNAPRNWLQCIVGPPVPPHNCNVFNIDPK